MLPLQRSMLLVICAFCYLAHVGLNNWDFGRPVLLALILVFYFTLGNETIAQSFAICDGDPINRLHKLKSVMWIYDGMIKMNFELHK